MIDISGGYSVEGRNADGSAYSGRLSVAQSASDLRFDWQVGSAYSGTGLIEGRIVTIDWGSTTPVVYVVMPNGALHGTWADGTALERATPD
ncbi:hypothetical protein KTJ87_09575 [Rhodobacteraceae bacterium ASV31]|nr:hypothetical protein [Anianabacter salinae]